MGGKIKILWEREELGEERRNWGKVDVFLTCIMTFGEDMVCQRGMKPNKLTEVTLWE